MNRARELRAATLERYPHAVVTRVDNDLLELYLGEGKYQRHVAAGLHYALPDGNMAEVDTDLTLCSDGRADLCTTATHLDLLANMRLTPGAPVIAVEFGGSFVRYIPEPLRYRNAAGLIEEAAPVQPASAQVQGAVISFPGAYGPGTRLEYEATAGGFLKRLVLETPDAVPPPSVLMTAGGDVRLELPVRLDVPPDVEARIASRAINMANDETTAGRVMMEHDGGVFVNLIRPFVEDANGVSVQGRLKFGTTITGKPLASASVPQAFLATAAYPVVLDPTLTEDTSSAAIVDWQSRQSGTTTFSSTGTTLEVGSQNASNFNVQSGFIIPSDLPKGAIVSEAYLTFTCTLVRTAVPTIEICGIAEDNASNPGGAAAHGAKSLTTARPTWTFANSTGVKTSSNVASVVQEIIDRAGWASGNGVGFILRQQGGDTYTSQQDVVFASNDNTTTANRPSITYTYITDAPPAQPTGLVATGYNQRVYVTWNANGESDLAGYRLSRDGTQIYQGTATAFDDTGRVNNQQYAYSLVAYDNGGNVSPAATTTGTPRGTVTKTATYTVQVGGDDGYTSGAATGLNANGSFLIVNDIDASNYDYRSFFRLLRATGDQLPQGTQLTAATLYLTKKAGATGATASKFTMQAADSGVSPTNKSAFDSAAKLTPISWTPSSSWQNSDDQRGIDVTSLVQQILNRAGYTAASALLFYWLHNADNFGSSNNNYQIHSFESDPAKAPYVVLTWEQKAPPSLKSALSGA